MHLGPACPAWPECRAGLVACLRVGVAGSWPLQGAAAGVVVLAAPCQVTCRVAVAAGVAALPVPGCRPAAAGVEGAGRALACQRIYPGAAAVGAVVPAPPGRGLHLVKVVAAAAAVEAALALLPSPGWGSPPAAVGASAAVEAAASALLLPLLLLPLLLLHRLPLVPPGAAAVRLSQAPGCQPRVSSLEKGVAAAALAAAELALLSSAPEAIQATAAACQHAAAPTLLLLPVLLPPLLQLAVLGPLAPAQQPKPPPLPYQTDPAEWAALPSCRHQSATGRRRPPQLRRCCSEPQCAPEQWLP